MHVLVLNSISATKLIPVVDLNMKVSVCKYGLFL